MTARWLWHPTGWLFGWTNGRKLRRPGAFLLHFGPGYLECLPSPAKQAS